jgi:hypothetical protein
MRLDYFHTGNSKQEIFSVDRVVVEPLPWPGNLKRAIDQLNLGKYFFEVHDKKSSDLLYSRGFASIYGEWEETDEEDKEDEEDDEVVVTKKNSIHIYERWWRSSAICI